MKIKNSKLSKAIRIILEVITSVSLILAVLSTFCYAFVINADEYRTSILTEQFDYTTVTEYKKCIESINSIVEIDTNKVFEAVSTNEIEAFEHNYVITVVTSIIENKEIYLQKFSSQELSDVINQEISRYCDENKLEFKPEEAQEIYEYICGYIDSTLEFIPNVIMSYLKKAASLFNVIGVFAQLYLPFYFVALVTFVLNLSIAKKHHALDVLIGTASGFWIAITTFAVPIGLLSAYDVPSKLVLSKNLFYYFVSGICDVAINKFAIFLLIVFVIATAILVVAAIVKNRKKKKEYSLRAYIDENGEILNEIYLEKTVDKVRDK